MPPSEFCIILMKIQFQIYLCMEIYVCMESFSVPIMICFTSVLKILQSRTFVTRCPCFKSKLKSIFQRVSGHHMYIYLAVIYIIKHIYQRHMRGGFVYTMSVKCDNTIRCRAHRWIWTVRAKSVAKSTLQLSWRCISRSRNLSNYVSTIVDWDRVHAE